MPKRSASNGDIYKLLSDLRLELKSDIKDVATQVTDLSKTVNDNEVKQAVSSTKIGMLITGITISASAITTIIMDKVTGRTPL
jgi:hypothetical protein